MASTVEEERNNLRAFRMWCAGLLAGMGIALVTVSVWASIIASFCSAGFSFAWERSYKRGKR